MGGVSLVGVLRGFLVSRMGPVIGSLDLDLTIRP